MERVLTPLFLLRPAPFPGIRFLSILWRARANPLKPIRRSGKCSYNWHAPATAPSSTSATATACTTPPINTVVLLSVRKSKKLKFGRRTSERRSVPPRVPEDSLVRPAIAPAP